MTTSETFFYVVGFVSCGCAIAGVPIWLLVKFETLDDARRKAEGDESYAQKQLMSTKRELDIVRAEVEDLKARGPYR
jgi:hypothetical protein